MKNLAVHLHLYYIKQLPEVLHYLANLSDVDYDLYVTVSSENEEIIHKIKTEYPRAKIWVVENRGYDVGPFIDFLNHVNLDDYKYILKLHTKGKSSKNYTWLNGNRFNNALWGKVLWDSMLADNKRLSENINILERNDKIGMVGSKYCFTNSKKDYANLLPQINTELKKLGQEPVEKISFIAGSMFLARADIFAPLKAYEITDFTLTDGNIKEGTLAHIVERLFGALVLGQGYEIKTIKHNGYGIYFAYVALKRFLFQQKITNSGKKLIKICKLPVYSKPLRG